MLLFFFVFSLHGAIEARNTAFTLLNVIMFIYTRSDRRSADLRHQHLFVLEAGDPREMSCNSENHSSRDGPFAWPCMLRLFEYLIRSTHKQSQTIASFPSSHTQILYSLLFESSFRQQDFHFSPDKKSSHSGALCSSLCQPALCRGRAKERAAKP